MRRCKNCGACQECGAPMPWNPWPIYPWLRPSFPYPNWTAPQTTPTVPGYIGDSAAARPQGFSYSSIGGMTNVSSSVPLH